MKKRFFIKIPVLKADKMKDVSDYLTMTYKKAVMHTAHFEKVLVFPTNDKPEITVILVSKSVDHANQYESNDRDDIGKYYKADLEDTGLVGSAEEWTSTTEE